MCGIVGLLLKKQALRPRLGELMLPMLIGMTERGPDSAGMAVFTEPVADGRCKLSLYSGGGAAGARFDWAALETQLKTSCDPQAQLAQHHRRMDGLVIGVGGLAGDFDNEFGNGKANGLDDGLRRPFQNGRRDRRVRRRGAERVRITMRRKTLKNGFRRLPF